MTLGNTVFQYSKLVLVNLGTLIYGIFTSFLEAISSRSERLSLLMIFTLLESIAVRIVTSGRGLKSCLSFNSNRILLISTTMLKDMRILAFHSSRCLRNSPLSQMCQSCYLMKREYHQMF